MKRSRRKNNQAEALAIWNQLAPKIREEIKRQTNDCIRQKKVTVVTAPNGLTLGVMQPNDPTILEVPYVSSLSNVPVGQVVMLQSFYGLSNAIAVSLGNGQGGTGGGGGGGGSNYLWYPNISDTGVLTFFLSESTTPPAPVNIIGPKGEPGQNGTDGTDATINGVTTLQIVAGQNISLSQTGSTLTISSPYQSNIVLQDQVTGQNYAMIIENGTLELLGVSNSQPTGDINILDSVTGINYSLIVENGVLKLEEVT